MRVSPVGWVAESKEEVKMLFRKVIEISHNHPNGIKGTKAIAMVGSIAEAYYGIPIDL